MMMDCRGEIIKKKMESQLGSFKAFCCNEFISAKGKAKDCPVSSQQWNKYSAGLMKSCPHMGATSFKDNYLQQQFQPHINLEITYQANDGDRFTSNSQGLRVSSIRTSKPYSSENTANMVNLPSSTFKHPGKIQHQSLSGHFYLHHAYEIQ